MKRVCVSEHIEITEIEKLILGDELCREPKYAEVYLAWNEKIDSTVNLLC